MNPVMLLISFLITAILVLTSCQNMPLANQQISNDTSKVNPTASLLHLEQKTFTEAVKNKKPYNGPIRIRMNPSLIKPSHHDIKDLSTVLSESNFKTQAIPEGNIVFQEIFTKSSSNLEITRHIQVQDTTKRYTLYIQKLDNQDPETEVSININGIDYIKQFTFTNTLEIARNTLLLNTNNSLRIRLQGSRSASVKVILIEGGQTGTVLRNRGNLGLPSETQETHIQQNNTNIFNPNNTNSLGDLIPYQGDVEADSGGRSISISKSFVNEDVEMLFETGVFEVEFTSDAAFESFKTYYSAEVLDFNEIHQHKIYLLKVDLNKSPIGQLVPLLRSYNQHIPVDITSVDFSSLASMQTFTVVLDTIVNHPEWLESISLNMMADGHREDDWVYNPFWSMYPDNFPDIPGIQTNATTQQAYKNIVNNILSTPHLDSTGNIIQNANWSMTYTGVPNTWDYSLGTGVKVAWLDQNVRTTHPELKRRYVFTAYNPVNEACLLCGAIGGPGQREHGHYSMMVGFAEKDNGLYTAGVAPNAQVMPFHTVLHWDMVKALQTIREKNLDIDIIGTSVGWTITEYLASAAIEEAGQGTIPPIVRLIGSFFRSPGLEYEIKDLYTRPDPIIFIQSAGNNGSRNDESPNFSKAEFVPNLKLPGVISVSAATLRKDNSGFPIFANAAFSNYYQSNTSFWAPGQFLFVSDYFGGNGGSNSNVPEWFDGTSAASPFLTGVVALMKSRNPDITIDQIKDVLTQTGATLNHKNPVFKNEVQTTELPTFQLSNTRFVNALEAVKAAIRLDDPNPESYQADTYFGLVTSDRKIKLAASAAANAAPQYKEKQLIQSVSDKVWNEELKPGDFVALKGWTDMKAGQNPITANQLEVLHADRICTLASTGCVNLGNIPFEPHITSIAFDPAVPVSENGFKMRINGVGLIPRLLDGFASKRFTLQARDITWPSSQQPITIDIPSTNINVIYNNGTYVEIQVPPFNTPVGDYVFRLQGVAATPYFGPSSTTGFKLNAAGGGSGNCNKWYVRAFNIDDNAAIYLNQDTVPVVSKGYKGDTDFVYVNSFLQPDTNKFRFELYNQLGGYAWGFQVKKNDQIVHQSIAGEAGVTGANSNDRTRANQVITDPWHTVTLDAMNPCEVQGGFQILGQVPANAPPDIDVWLTSGSNRTQVSPSDLIGLAIQTEDHAHLKIEIDGLDMPIRQIAENYVAFGIPTNLSEGVKDVIIKLAGDNVTLQEAIQVIAMPPLQQVQTLNTRQSVAVKAFDVNNTHFVGFTSNSNNYATHLYKWSNNQLEHFQNLPTAADYDIEAFSIGSEHYLSIAFWNQGWFGNSKVFKWNGNQFTLFQEVATIGATDSEHFVMNGDHYLLLANNGVYASNLVDQTSQLLKWTGNSFVQVQGISTHAAFKWEHMQIGTEHYLALAAHHYTGPAVQTNKIYKWNGAQFVETQQLTGILSLDAESFQIGNEHFLAITNHGDFPPALPAEEVSKIYRFNPGTGMFESFQDIFSIAARKWHHFVKDGVHYLSLANDTSTSRVYRWNGSQFELYRVLPNGGTWDWEFLTVGVNQHLLIGSTYYFNGSVEQPSVVYRFK